MKDAVVVRDLERRFGKFVAVNRISFAVKQGEIFGFLGPNGAGKSTTIRMLCGILAPTGGGGTVASFDLRTQAEQIKAHIGYMSQRFSLYEDLTVEENIDFYSGIYGIASGKKRARKEWVIEMAGLAEHRNALTGTLSSGWKQRLALGCAILHEPPILFLDEPTSGVDPNSRRRFWDLIYELSGQGVTVFVTTHYMDEAEHCDRLALIYRGELIASGSPQSLKAEAMAETILEVLCDRPEDAIEVIEATTGAYAKGTFRISDSAFRIPDSEFRRGESQRAELASLLRGAALFGKGLHVAVRDAAAAAPALRQLLEQRGHRVRRIEPIAPSMEDVFVSLIERHDRLHHPLAEVQR
jgi:ABC-2 type transport system ATP-binding protein